MSGPKFYEETEGIVNPRSSHPIFFKIINGKRVKMTIEDIRNPMIQPYDRYEHEYIIKEVKPDKFVYSYARNNSNITEDNTNNAETIENVRNLFKGNSTPSTITNNSGRSITPSSNDEPPTKKLKNFGSLPSFMKERQRKSRRQNKSRRIKGRKTLRR
jgi:hypothetical protein